MKKRFVAASVVATLSALALTAHADDDPSAVAAARTIGVEGLKLAEAGNCKDAIEKLDRAEKLHHAPTTQYRLGECLIKTGRLVLGTEHLRRLTRETLDSKAPPAFAAAQKNAQKLLDETTPRIAQLHVNVAVPAGVQPQVTIDGEAIPAALLEIDRPTDPGSHTIEAIAPGHKKTAQQVALKEGEKLTVDLTPEVDKTAAPVEPPPPPPTTTTAPPPPPPAEPPPPPAKQGMDTWRIVGWSLVGVGAAGLVTGVIAGSMGLGTKSDLNDSCDAQKICGPEQQDKLDRLQTEATIGTIGFVIGGAGLIGGGALLLFGPKSNVTVGLGSVGYRGTF